MERESFEDAEVAGILRDNFIAVKVDKEERPDIDAVYMQITQAMTGSGGWPMTLLLTPDKRPFFAGTYFPKYSRRGMSGILDILNAASLQWKTGRHRIEEIGIELTRILQPTAPERGTAPDEKLIKNAYLYFSAVFDRQNGGFGRAPKFPSPHNLMFLLRYSIYEREPHAAEMAEKTLVQMYRGGIFDHIGYGFSRYSTDERWLVPHFEKMLYDNALLTIAYIEAYQVTGNPILRRVAENTLAYITREMSGEGFYSAQDADSDGHEGKYYLWSPEEIINLLGRKDGEYWNNRFNITPKGNFEGMNIPNLLDNPNYAEVDPGIERLISDVYKHRASRVRLHKDDKALTSWNALMTTAFAKAYTAFGSREYLYAAERGAAFIREKLTGKDGGLYVSYRDTEARGSGYLDDYVFYVWSLLSLYRASFDAGYLESAINYAEKMCELFEDTENGGFYLYSRDAEKLIIRPKETYDGAMPSGNSAAALVLCKISALTGSAEWEERSRRQLEFMSAASAEHPASCCFSHIAAMSEIYPRRELICATPSQDDLPALQNALAGYLDLEVLVLTPGNKERMAAIIPALRGYNAQGGKTTFYVCRNNMCSAPFTGFDELKKALGTAL